MFDYRLRILSLTLGTLSMVLLSAGIALAGPPKKAPQTTAVRQPTKTAQARGAYHRVVAYVSMPYSKKRWDLRSLPDLSICVDAKCWPRPKSYAGPPTTPSQMKRSLCKNADKCYVGCDHQQRIYVRRRGNTQVSVYDIDRWSSNDLIGSMKCAVKPGKEITCRSKRVRVDFFPYSRSVCRSLKKKGKYVH